jgi:hypothetical protein
LLVDRGLLSPSDLAVALARQAESGLSLGRILVDQGFVHSSAVAMALADQHGGLLKTEYGFATGRAPMRSTAVPTEQDEPQVPLLRLAPNAEPAAPAEEPDPPAPGDATIADLRAQLQASEIRRRAAEVAVDRALKRMHLMQQLIAGLQDAIGRPKKRSWWSR